MLTRVVAQELVREATSGRTKPLILNCDSESGEPIEVFCKISDGFEEGQFGLAREVVAACLATLLKLPVPSPCLVDLPPDLAEVVHDSRIAARIRTSSSVAFGSIYVSKPFSAWPRGKPISRGMLPLALGTFVFDAVIENADRRPDNPNCLVAGEEITLIDHELSFPRSLVGNVLPPWKTGGIEWLSDRNRHIFSEPLRKHARNLDFGPIRELWLALSDRRLDKIRAAIPEEWDEVGPYVGEVLRRVQQARDNIDSVIIEAKRVLR